MKCTILVDPSLVIITTYLVSSLLPGIDQKTKYVVMTTKEGYTKVVHFMTSGTRVLLLMFIVESAMTESFYLFIYVFDSK